MNDTNDEWNDDTLVHTPVVNNKKVIPKRKVSSNPNGIKDHIEELLLGRKSHPPITKKLNSICIQIRRIY